MSFPKFPGLIVMVVCFTSFSPADAGAQTNSSTPFEVSLRTSVMPGSEPVRSAVLTVGTNHFYFGVPRGFRLDGSNPHKIVLMNDDNCYLTFRIIGPMSGNQELNPEVYREMLLQRYPGGKIMSQFSLTAVNRNGPAFDLQWKNSGGAYQSQRIVFIPSTAGVLEFSFMTNPDKLSVAEYFFNSFLLGFSNDAGSKPGIANTSDSN